ncbi:hypothetical protein Bca52824_018991 [Brassica carinata]|uniref:Uncharacterized protein n=1 Tax=Brassica carinata TaxID=52824 RepID=A0A8X7VQI5_BRACI|nr:hypothetical protein Bca52824_018991 [Brassica carinata]
MGEAFVGLNLMVETKLEAVDLRLGGIEKGQRLLRSRAKKIEKRLTSIESKVSEKPNLGEDMDFGQWDGNHDEDAGKRDEEGEKEKEDVEQEARNHDEDGEKEKEKEESEYKLMQERSRVQADAFWKGVDEQEKRELAEIAEEEEREKEKKIAEEEKEESESGDEERVEESEAEEDEKVEEEENVGRELAEEEEKAEESESSEKEKEKKKEKEKEKEMSGDEADIIMASVLSEINESLVEYATPTPPPPPPRETPTPPPRETPTTPKKLKLPPVDLNKNPVEEEEFGGKEVRWRAPRSYLDARRRQKRMENPGRGVQVKRPHRLLDLRIGADQG